MQMLSKSEGKLVALSKKCNFAPQETYQKI